MNKIETYSCKRGHKYLLTKMCPFCCAIDKICPEETNELFVKIYRDIKEKSEEEINTYYLNYLPTEPEDDFTDNKSLFW